MNYKQIIQNAEMAIAVFNQRHTNFTHHALHKKMVSGVYALNCRLNSTHQHHEKYIESIQSYTQTGQITQDDFDLVDEHLFGFFYCGLSAIECWVYGVYTACQLIEQFTRSEQDITVQNAISDLKKHPVSSSFAKKLSEVKSSNEYEEWNLIRNVLTHRGIGHKHFMESFYVTQNPSQNTKSWKAKLSLDDSTEIQLDKTTTEHKFLWLVDSLDQLVTSGSALLHRI